MLLVHLINSAVLEVAFGGGVSSRSSHCFEFDEGRYRLKFRKHYTIAPQPVPEIVLNRLLIEYIRSLNTACSVTLLYTRYM